MLGDPLSFKSFDGMSKSNRQRLYEKWFGLAEGGYDEVFTKTLNIFGAVVGFAGALFICRAFGIESVLSGLVWYLLVAVVVSLLFHIAVVDVILRLYVSYKIKRLSGDESSE